MLSYVGHFSIYAALAYCLQTALDTRRALAALVIIAGLGLGGGLLEVYQSTLAGRESSAYDALANLLGAAAGCGVSALLLPFWRNLLGFDEPNPP